ncbi:hypothetical protein KQI63_06035 [bacterium]|nr:hypothetical protein [bacterium]
MKRVLEVVVALIVGTILALLLAPLAQAAASDGSIAYRGERNVSFDGKVSISAVYHTYDAGSLDNLASEMGIDEPSDGMVLYNLTMMGRQNDRVSIGGRFFWGHDRTTGGLNASGNSYSREITTHFRGAGFMMEYDALRLSRFTLSGSLMIGGGKMSVYLRQDDGTASWQEVTGAYTGDPGNTPVSATRVRIERDCFLLQPEVNARFHLLDWMALEGSVGWQYDTLDRSGWRHNDIAISGRGPDLNFRQPFYRVGLAIGL